MTYQLLVNGETMVVKDWKVFSVVIKLLSNKNFKTMTIERMDE